ncbi:MAG TPA: family 16 glycosylhydrolase [Prolixibacteraceae bacterium]|nr:family 16 glycosylhydrolase [Bacteroidales bacterium]HPB05165.1 family 16 glycosylhydrolase [Prolixibacteraceae bacterium]HQN92638.1 family 16 glycosylhydrolase [Prolixibacteraceae bacterium]HUM88648.1 family 16 glycosylhydrolase [Prolixibacteraceae bacterium]
MFLFGKSKSVAKIEQEWQQLKDDYQVYTEVEGSKKLKDFLALKEKVESAPFKARKKEIEGLQFKGSPEETMVKRFEKLEADPKLKTYYKVHASDDLKRYKKLKDQDLKPDSLEADFCKKYSKSPDYRIFTELDGSTLVSDFENLKKEVSSEKFKERKAFLEDKYRYLKTEDHELLEKYKQLENDEAIKLYFKYNETDSFKFFREWSLVLEESFSQKIDKSKWSFISPVAEKGPGRNFSVNGQLQCYNDDKNIDTENGIFTLETHQEKKEGLYWDENFGFVMKDFNYTSGLMHSNNFFKQEYGLFEMKLKASKVRGVISSVSLADDDENECIRLISLDFRKASGGIIITEQGQRLISKVNMKHKLSGYLLLSVEWTPERIEWRVNDRFMGALSQNVPHEKLGLRIETEVVKSTSNLPHRLDIDWIRCYKRRKI